MSINDIILDNENEDLIFYTPRIHFENKKYKLKNIPEKLL